MKRVAIIGRGASGKSTLAVRLGEITGLPVIELDKIFWQPGLLATPRDHWTAIQERLVAEERWIMDGDQSLRRADRIITLDRFMKDRWSNGRKSSRVDRTCIIYGL